jgi:hypothetical protein
MRFQDGLVGFASGLVVGLAVAWFTIIRMSYRLFGLLTDDALMYSGFILVGCGILGIFAVYRYFQLMRDSYQAQIVIRDNSELNRFLIDVLATKKYRLVEGDGRAWVFQSLVSLPRWLNYVFTPLPSEVECIYASYDGQVLTLRGPLFARMLLKDIIVQIQARNG